MSASSRHLTALVDRVAAGAHLVLRGHLGDEVLFDGEVRDERWAIAELLRTRAGFDAVVVADQADGLQCLDEADEARIGALLAAAAIPGAALGAVGALGVAAAVRVLLEGEELAVAVLLADAGLLFEPGTEQGRRAIGLLVEAMSAARYVPREGGMPVRNALIVYGAPSGRAVDLLAATPGVVEQVVEPPDRHERLLVLRSLASGFYDDDGLPPPEQALQSLARVTHGSSLRELEHLRRHSHIARTPASRPESLHRSARGETSGTAIERVGVETMMSMLEDEVVGQPAAMGAIRAALEAGRRPAADRPPGSSADRPLATLVLHGPPGVGKTETGLVLSEALLGSRGAVRRIDCSEFNSDADLAWLVGAPPGYIGYGDGSRLVEALGERAAVIVLDEFDRAPARLVELLLGILDAGRLNDGRGGTASFGNAVLILTTNAGSEELAALVADGAPPTADLLAHSAATVARRLQTDRAHGGIGSPALWSRLRRSLVPYDILRRDAIEAMVARSCRNIAVNLGDELDLQVDFDTAAFATAVADRLPADGLWDGRSVRPLVGELIERPARDRLEACAPGSAVRLGPGASGFACLT